MYEFDPASYEVSIDGVVYLITEGTGIPVLSEGDAVLFEVSASGTLELDAFRFSGEQPDFQNIFDRSEGGFSYFTWDHPTEDYSFTAFYDLEPNPVYDFATLDIGDWTFFIREGAVSPVIRPTSSH
jgi:hypothetical protein